MSNKGLTTIHDPDEPKVDIVLVHGLMGHRKNTWTHANKTFWPEDLLPEDCPDARILSFGYDSKVVHFWSRPADNNIDSFSNALFQRLASDRAVNEVSTRPIIFVVHSLGGIVLANALVDSATNDYKDLAACVRAIAFLGTPHKGSDKAAWGKLGEKMVKWLGKSTNESLLEALDDPAVNEKLAKIGDSFPSMLRMRAKDKDSAIEVVCFYEGQPMTKLGGVVNLDKIVEESSATLSGYTKILLDADHEKMCKFEDKDDGNYKHVAGQLAQWCKEFSTPVDLDARKAGINKTANFYGANYGLQQFENSGTQTNNFGFQAPPPPAPGRRN